MNESATHTGTGAALPGQSEESELRTGRKVVFTEDYTGRRWAYGLRNRPPGGGAIPRGFIIGSHRTGEDLYQAGHRHGVIEYPFALTAKEAAGYELTDLGEC